MRLEDLDIIHAQKRKEIQAMNLNTYEKAVTILNKKLTEITVLKNNITTANKLAAFLLKTEPRNPTRHELIKTLERNNTALALCRQIIFTPELIRRTLRKYETLFKDTIEKDLKLHFLKNNDTKQLLQWEKLFDEEEEINDRLRALTIEIKILCDNTDRNINALTKKYLKIKKERNEDNFWKSFIIAYEANIHFKKFNEQEFDFYSFKDSKLAERKIQPDQWKQIAILTGF